MRDDAWFKKCEILPCNMVDNEGNQKSGYKVNVHIHKKFDVECDEGKSSFKNTEIGGIKCQMYSDKVRFFAREFQLQFFVPELGKIMDEIRGVPLKQRIKKRLLRELHELQEDFK